MTQQKIDQEIYRQRLIDYVKANSNKSEQQSIDCLDQNCPAWRQGVAPDAGRCRGGGHRRRRMIYYIAGPISNCLKTYQKAFHDVDQPLRDAGNSVLDPSFLPPGLSQGQYMQICLPMVAVAYELVMLPGWEQSEGAYIEFCLAKKSGKTIRDAEMRVIHQGENNE